jgi:hypothetical protein
LATQAALRNCHASAIPVAGGQHVRQPFFHRTQQGPVGLKTKWPFATQVRA